MPPQVSKEIPSSIWSLKILTLFSSFLFKNCSLRWLLGLFIDSTLWMLFVVVEPWALPLSSNWYFPYVLSNLSLGVSWFDRGIWSCVWHVQRFPYDDHWPSGRACGFPRPWSRLTTSTVFGSLLPQFGQANPRSVGEISFKSRANNGQSAYWFECSNRSPHNPKLPQGLLDFVGAQEYSQQWIKPQAPASG